MPQEDFRFRNRVSEGVIWLCIWDLGIEVWGLGFGFLKLRYFAGLRRLQQANGQAAVEDARAKP